MTKKDFELLARILYSAGARAQRRGDTAFLSTFPQVVEEIAQGLAFSHFNFNFRKDMFVAACGTLALKGEAQGEEGGS